MSISYLSILLNKFEVTKNMIYFRTLPHFIILYCFLIKKFRVVLYSGVLIKKELSMMEKHIVL